MWIHFVQNKLCVRRVECTSEWGWRWSEKTESKQSSEWITHHVKKRSSSFLSPRRCSLAVSLLLDPRRESPDEIENICEKWERRQCCVCVSRGNSTRESSLTPSSLPIVNEKRDSSKALSWLREYILYIFSIYVMQKGWSEKTRWRRKKLEKKFSLLFFSLLFGW